MTNYDKIYINGQWVASEGKNTISVFDSTNEEVMATIPEGTAGDVNKAAAAAIKDTFGKDAIPVRGGGSIPICALFEKELGIKIVFMGFGLDSDNLHSPNEKYDIFNFYKGIETIPYFHKHFAEA